MILMATICVSPSYTDTARRIPFLLVLCLFVGMMTSYFIYFSRTLRGLIPSSGKFGRVRHIFSELDSAFLLVNDQKRVVWLSILVSLVGQGILIVLVYGLARSLAINEASLLQFFIFEPLIFIITALPISVGGWGIQEGAFAFLKGGCTQTPSPFQYCLS